MNDNWTPKKSPPELSEADAELLSAYIDQMLSADEVQALEMRLAEDAFLRRELAAMRQTVDWLNTMPRPKAPRNFTLKESDVKASTPKIISLPARKMSWQMMGTAAAVFVLVFVGASAIFLNNGLVPKSESPADVALYSTQTDALSRENGQEETFNFMPTTTATTTAMPTMTASNLVLVAPIAQPTMAAASGSGLANTNPASEAGESTATELDETTVDAVVMDNNISTSEAQSQLEDADDGQTQELAIQVTSTAMANVTGQTQGGSLDTSSTRNRESTAEMPMPQGTPLPETMAMTTSTTEESAEEPSPAIMSAPTGETSEEANASIMVAPVEEEAVEAEIGMAADTGIAMGGAPSFAERLGSMIGGLLKILEALQLR